VPQAAFLLIPESSYGAVNFDVLRTPEIEFSVEME
jgi:hypothetical protein